MQHRQRWLQFICLQLDCAAQRTKGVFGRTGFRGRRYTGRVPGLGPLCADDINGTDTGGSEIWRCHAVGRTARAAEPEFARRGLCECDEDGFIAAVSSRMSTFSTATGELIDSSSESVRCHRSTWVAYLATGLTIGIGGITAKI